MMIGDDTTGLQIKYRNAPEQISKSPSVNPHLDSSAAAASQCLRVVRESLGVPWMRNRPSLEGSEAVYKTLIFLTLFFAISSPCFQPLTSVSEWGFYERVSCPA
jgi:hypothetical protein